MNRPALAAIIAVAFWLASPLPSEAFARNDAIDRARSLLAKSDPKAAVLLLEAALPGAGADLGPMVVVLRQAYTRAADQATKAGRKDEADDFRENLQILNRKLRGPVDEPSPAPAPEIGTTAKAAPIEEPKPAPPAPEPATIPPLAVETPSPLPALPGPEPARPRPEPEPVAKPEPTAKADPVASTAEILAVADRAYLAEQYLEASQGYAWLAKAGQLPAERKAHWAYCRSVDVVRRIKAGPTTKAEWASIDREIGEIKILSPKYWYAEYLRNRAADLSRGASKPAKGQAPIVRGAMPEAETDTSPAAIRDLTRKVPAVPSQPPVGRFGKPGEIALARLANETPKEISTHGDSGNWQVKETANFTIYHADPALADKVAQAAESSREAITRRWTGSAPARRWTPRCEVYLYPTAAIFSQVTHQPPESPGFSTMESNGISISVRRINLRADHATLMPCVLPHEITHVILADLFPAQQVPRWADEGISVLSEPVSEQARRITDLDAALDGGKIFSIEHMMVRDYPEGPFWGLYYAQSVSLTRFLVDLGKPGQFIEFLQSSQRNGIEPELRRIYKIDGYPDLQARWLEHARASSAQRLAAAKDEAAPKTVR